MGENGLSVADALALQNKNNNGCNGDGAFGGNGAWWVIILILFFAFAGWGNGRNGNGNGGCCDGGTNTVVIPANMGGFGGFSGGYNPCCTPATQQGLTSAFNFNQLDNGIRGLERGLCDGFYTSNLAITNLGTSMQNGFCSSDRANLQSFNALGSSINQGFNGVESAIAQTNYNLQNCCCQNKEAIAQTNYNMQTGFNSITNQLASCCCELGRGQDSIKNAIQQSTCDILVNQEKNTDRIINHLVQTELDALRTELQSAQFQLSQNAQTSNIVNQLLPVAKPAYLTCSPYAAAMGVNCGYNTNCNTCC